MMDKTTGFILGVLTGVLVGAAAGLLLAPSSGEETRQLIRNRAQYVQDEVKRAATERRAELEQQLADLRAPRRSETMPGGGGI